MKNLKYIAIVFILTMMSCKSDDATDPVDEGDSFTVKIENEEVEEGTILEKTYNVVGNEGEMGFNITNNKDTEIKLKMTVVSVEGNGTGMQLCFNSCSANINADDTEIKTIAAGHTTTNVETHIFNGQSGDRNFSCTVKINQVDTDGNDISGGKSVMFKYNYVKL